MMMKMKMKEEKKNSVYCAGLGHKYIKIRKITGGWVKTVVLKEL